MTDLPELTAPEYRRDPITGRWIILSTARSRRPIAGERIDAPPALADARRLGPDPECPFCEGNEGMTPPESFALRREGGRDGPGWSVRVVPNRYPAVSGSLSQELTGRPSLLQAEAGAGVHEVVIECPEHVWTVSGCSAEHLGDVFEVYQQRLRFAGRQPGVRQGLIFKNAGVGAGASQIHAHAQVLATKHLHPHLAEEFAGSARYFEQTGRSVFSDLLAAELDDGRRVAVQTPNFVALCPFASRFPFEVWVLPRQAVPRFDHHETAQFRELGGLMRRLLAAVERFWDRPAYNYFIHTAPFDSLDAAHYHWHVELAPRLVGLAGSELGGGTYINPIPPEWAAERYRAMAMEETQPPPGGRD